MAVSMESMLVQLRAVWALHQSIGIVKSQLLLFEDLTHVSASWITCSYWNIHQQKKQEN